MEYNPTGLGNIAEEENNGLKKHEKNPRSGERDIGTGRKGGREHERTGQPKTRGKHRRRKGKNIGRC